MSTVTESASPPIHRRHARRTAVVLPMTNAAGPRARLDAGGTRLRLRALHVMGHGSARIARALGVREETIQRLVRGDTTLISPNLRDTITDLYDAWSDKRAPERTRADRAAAARARRRACAANWCAPMALDDDKLDTPGYRPQSRYRPAAGTGVATDLHPPTPLHPRRASATTPELVSQPLPVVDREA